MPIRTDHLTRPTGGQAGVAAIVFSSTALHTHAATLCASPYSVRGELGGVDTCWVCLRKIQQDDNSLCTMQYSIMVV